MAKGKSHTNAQRVEADPRWAHVVARNPAADSLFVYAVRTTGIYCLPSSPSRLPLPQNVEFFDSAAQAEAAGYRRSQRETSRSELAAHHARLVAQACEQIAQGQDLPSLIQLAEQANMSPWHFHRVFKAATGLTPKAYANAHRSNRVRSHLTRTHSVTDALYNAGFNSNSRFYESSDKLLGMKPTQYQKAGRDVAIHFALGECSLGSILVAQSARGVCAILLGDDPGQLIAEFQDQFHNARLIGADSDFEQLVAQVVGLIEAPGLGTNLPLDVQGTAFQQRVWQALTQIAPGSTASYAEIAERMGAPKSYRAVAQACAANVLAVAIPCHRVVRSDGALSGYRWGVERKRQLLAREAQANVCNSLALEKQ